MPRKLYRHIYKEKNFLYLNGKSVLQPKMLQIIKEFLDEGESHYKELRNNCPTAKAYFDTFIPKLFSEIYCLTVKSGFDLKTSFHIIFKTYKDK